MRRTTDHWADRLQAIVKTHIEQFRQQRNDLVARVAPPSVLFDVAFNSEDRKALPIGKRLNGVYSSTRSAMLRNKKTGEALTDAENDRIRQAVEGYLEQFPDEQQEAILRAALLEAHLSDAHTDGAVWLAGPKTEDGHAPGLAQKTLQALRSVDVLSEIAEVEGQVVVYPGAIVQKPDFQGSIGLNGVWFNWYCQQQVAAGKALPTTQRDVPKDAVKQAKAEVARLAESDWQGLPLTIRRESERLKAYTESGALFGFVDRESEKYIGVGQMRLGFVLAADGNLRAMWTNSKPV